MTALPQSEAIDRVQPDYPTDEERAKAIQEGRAAHSIFDNPYNRVPGWPKPSVKGLKDEILARHWVDGYCSKK